MVTWSPQQKAPSGQPYRLIGYINEQQILERVETWVEHPVLGDLHVETFFRDYADFGGVHYVAWVIPPVGAGAIEILDLGDAELIEAKLSSARAILQRYGFSLPEASGTQK